MGASKAHSKDVKDRTLRLRVLTVVCPLCNAGVGKSCIGKDEYVRSAAHLQRIQQVANRPVFDPRCVDCPECDAAKGDPCVGKAGQIRISNHSVRVILARKKSP